MSQFFYFDFLLKIIHIHLFYCIFDSNMFLIFLFIFIKIMLVHYHVISYILIQKLFTPLIENFRNLLHPQKKICFTGV
jgi:hypothetical protein